MMGHLKAGPAKKIRLRLRSPRVATCGIHVATCDLCAVICVPRMDARGPHARFIVVYGRFKMVSMPSFLVVVPYTGYE